MVSANPANTITSFSDGAASQDTLPNVLNYFNSFDEAYLKNKYLYEEDFSSECSDKLTEESKTFFAG